MPDWSLLIVVGFFLIITGFLFLAISIISSSHRGADEKVTQEKTILEGSGIDIKGGGVILIGPIPIVMGTDKRYTVIILLLAITLMLLAMILE